MTRWPPLAAAILAAGVVAGSAQVRNEDMSDQQACPLGTVPVATNQPVEPFHCVRRMDPTTPFIQMTPNFKLPRCPRGSRPVETPGLGDAKRYRCVMDPEPDPQDPTVKPLIPPTIRNARLAQASSAQSAAEPRTPTRFEKRTLDGAFQGDFPRGWRVSDNWADPVPTYYAEFDTGRQGKQITLVVSKIEPAQEGYVDLDAAIERDKEWQNAVEEEPGRAAGFPARFTSVAKESRTAYIQISRDGDYFVLGYSAPEDLYKRFEPAFRRLLTTFRIAKVQRR